MSRWKLVRLKFGRNVAHFGERGIGIEETSERIRSDTLFSAWMSAYARLVSSHAVEDLITKFPQIDEQNSLINVPPLFRLSSTFIYQKIDGRFVDYLPRPLTFPTHYPVGGDFDIIKSFKKLKHLPLNIWKRWYQNEQFGSDTIQELTEATRKQTTGLLARSGTFDYPRAYCIQKLPKVAIDRTTRATNFYYTGVVGYRWEAEQETIENISGLYFLVEFPTKETEFDRTFFTVLDFLASEGIGGERSSGAGQFETDVFDLNSDWKQLIQFKKGTQHSLISLLWEPKMSPETLTQASYETKERGGWVTSPKADVQKRRQSVQMFTEGSTFPVEPEGKLADVTPRNFKAHRVYRSGIAISLPIKVKRSEST
ncbi:type III-A CRISPR-associated RAMP protein Csm4 [Leptothoe sp. ISB3NOV94-8A]